jgi:hypothetical protein
MGNSMIGWDVFLGRKCIDTVFYTPDCDAEYVRASLINHDGYDSRIVVSRSQWKVA